MATIYVSGIETLNRLLQQLSTRGQKAASRKAIAGGMKPIVQAEKAETPVLSGGLRQSTGWRFIKSKDKDPLTLAKAGPDVGRKLFKLHGKMGSRTVTKTAGGQHAPLVLLGTGKRTQKTTGRNTGTMPINAYIARARTASSSTAKQAIDTVFKAAIKVEWAKDRQREKQ